VVSVVEHGAVVGGEGGERLVVFFVMVVAQVNFRTAPKEVDILATFQYNTSVG
jgi:hypothetical protein